MYQQRNRQTGMEQSQTTPKEKIDLGRMSIEEIDKKAREIAKDLLNHKVTPTQLRNAFELIKRALGNIDNIDKLPLEKKNEEVKKVKYELILIKPKIAYMVKEEKSVPMVEYLLEAIESTVNAGNIETYKKLQVFNEALLGYFKYEYVK